MSEMNNLSLSGGRRRNHAPTRRGPIGALDRRQGLRNSLRRSKRNLRGVVRRIRGKGIPEEEEEEKTEGASLIVTEKASGAFCDNPDEGDNDHHQQEAKHVNEIDSDDNDDFMDPHTDDEDENDDDETDEDEDEEGSQSEHEKVHEDHEDGSDFDEDDTDESEHDVNGDWGVYHDEYEDSAAVSKDSKKQDATRELHHDSEEGSHRGGEDLQQENGGGYTDGEHRHEIGPPIGSPRKNYERRNSTGGRRNGLLKQLSKKFRHRGRNSISNLDHTSLAGLISTDPYCIPSSPPQGRIEGFGSTKPDFASPRTLRQKLKLFRENRIAARKDEEDGMKTMNVGAGDPNKKNWKEKIDSVVDAMVDASIPEAQQQGYMTSSSLMTGTRPTTSSSTPTSLPTPTKSSKLSYDRKQFGDDNAYIVYLEGEKVASELEVLSYKNRIKELEAETRKLKRVEGGNGDGGSTAPSDSSNAGEGETKESEIEWQTGVPEEGVLIDLEGTPAAPLDEQSTAAAPAIDLLQTPPPKGRILETAPETNAVPSWQNIKALTSSPAEQMQEIPAHSISATPMEPAEGDLVDLSVRDEAKDIVGSILADLLNGGPVTSLQSDEEEDVADTLLSLKLEQPSEQAETSDAHSKPPADPLPEPPTDGPPKPSAEIPPEPPEYDPVEPTAASSAGELKEAKGTGEEATEAEPTEIE